MNQDTPISILERMPLRYCLILHLFQDEIQSYVMFARQFKPKISLDSSEYMVEEYKRLRQRDSSGQWVQSSL